MQSTAVLYTAGLAAGACSHGAPQNEITQHSHLSLLADMSGGLPRSGPARGPVSPVRMDSCVQDPHQELLDLFRENNLRFVN